MFGLRAPGRVARIWLDDLGNEYAYAEDLVLVEMDRDFVATPEFFSEIKTRIVINYPNSRLFAISGLGGQDWFGLLKELRDQAELPMSWMGPLGVYWDKEGPFGDINGRLGAMFSDTFLGSTIINVDFHYDFLLQHLR